MNEIQIKYENEQLVVSSLQVANHFEKEHKHVIRDIENLVAKGGVQNWADLFHKTTYVHEQNKQEYPMYLINKKGFQLLAMGFTGTKAIQWKLKYIEAFETMEMELKQPYQLPRNYKEALLALVAKEEEKEQLEMEKEKLLLENKFQEQQIAELKPKADYTDKILKSKSLVTITQIAKDYGMSGYAMNKILNELQVQYKQSGQWLLYSKHQSHGYTFSETITYPDKNGNLQTKPETKWTQKGRLFLYDILKQNGYLPSIEREDI